MEPLADLPIRLIMIPAFGVAVPHLTGFFGPYGPRSPQYWMGLGWSLLISFAIWHGNRWFLLKQRRHYDWFDHPMRKISLLLFANIFYTAPVSVLMTLAWYWFAGLPPDPHVLRTVALACVICVVFITHVYETVYLIQQREGDLLVFERLERARAQAELDSLKAQVTPHFLFNSLNTLSWLIEHSPAKALEFNQNLAEVYRYILLSREREVVPLGEELDFLRQYLALLELRFEDSISLCAADAGERSARWFLPPISLQTLVENAVKHNQHSARHPLQLSLTFEEDCIAVANHKRNLLSPRPTAGVGLKSLDERCLLTLGRGIHITDDGQMFCVRVPVRNV